MHAMEVEQIADRRAARSALVAIDRTRATAAARRDCDACYELGVAFSTGADCDLIEAHMWFNLAAVWGHLDAADRRAELASEMSGRATAEAQRRARQWLAADNRRAA